MCILHIHITYNYAYRGDLGLVALVHGEVRVRVRTRVRVRIYTYMYRGDLGLVALVHGEVGQRAHHAGLHLDVAHVHARGLQQVRVRVG